LDQYVKRPSVTIVAFHGDGDQTSVALGVALDPSEEIPEARSRVRDFEFLEHAAICQTDGNTVTLCADINADT
jgi:hypothetical protein